MGSGSPGKKVPCRPQKIPSKLGLAHHPQEAGGTAETRGRCSPSCTCMSLPRLVTALDKNTKSSPAYEAWRGLGLPPLEPIPGPSHPSHAADTAAFFSWSETLSAWALHL